MSLPNGYDYLRVGEALVRLHDEQPEAYQQFFESLKPWRQREVDRFFERRRLIQGVSEVTATFYPHALEMVGRLSEKAQLYYVQGQRDD